MSIDLIIIAISLLIWGIGETAFIAFQSLYLQNLGAQPLQIGTIFGAIGFAAILVYIPAGYLSDRFGRRPLLWAGWFQGAIAAWIMALAKSLDVFAIGMVLYGMTMYVTTPLNSYVTAGRGKLSLVRAMTLVGAAYNVGAILGPFIGGWMGGRYGFRSIFLFAAVLFILASILIVFIKPQPRDILPHDKIPQRLIYNSRFLAFLPILFLVILATSIPQPLAPNYLQNQHGLSLENIGQLYSVMGLGIVIISLILGQIDPRIGFLLGQVMVGVFAGLLWKGNNILIFGLGYFILGGFRTLRTLAIAQVRPLIHGSNMGLAYGLLDSSAALATLLAAPLAGYLYSLHPTLMYTISLSFIIATLIITVIFTLYRRPQLNDEPVQLEQRSP